MELDLLEMLYIVTKDHKKHEIEPLNCDELILKQSWHVETLEFELVGKGVHVLLSWRD